MSNRDLQNPKPFAIGNHREFGPEAVSQGRGLRENLLDHLSSHQPEAAVHVLQGDLRGDLGEDVESSRQQDAMEGLVPDNLAANDDVVFGRMRPQAPEVAWVVLAVRIGEEGQGRSNPLKSFSHAVRVSLPGPPSQEAHWVRLRKLPEDLVGSVRATVFTDE